MADLLDVLSHTISVLVITYKELKMKFGSQSKIITNISYENLISAFLAFS